MAGAEALAAMGPSNASNWPVVQKGVPHLLQMLRTQDLSQVDVAVRPLPFSGVHFVEHSFLVLTACCLSHVRFENMVVPLIVDFFLSPLVSHQNCPCSSYTTVSRHYGKLEGEPLASGDQPVLQVA